MSRFEPMHRSAEEIAATVKKIEAETVKLLAEAEEQRYLTLMEQMSWEAKTALHEMLTASDDRARTYRISGEIDNKTVPAIIGSLTRWHRLDPGCDIKLVVTSPGGSVVDGMALFDFLCELREEGHHITAVTRGYAASMAGILLQAADRRVVGREAWVLIHEVSAGMMGSFGELEDRMKWLSKVQERILDIFAERSGGKKTREEFENAWKRTDFWLSSEMCLEWGVADEIA